MKVPAPRSQVQGPGDPRQRWLDSFVHRLLQDALASALPEHWERRARDFEFALSRPGDYPGRLATAADHVAHDRRVLEAARACRN